MKQITSCPLPLELAHLLLRELADIRREGKTMKYLRPDSKSQVTIEYNDNNQPIGIDTILVCRHSTMTLAPEAEMLATIKQDIQEVLVPRVVNQLPNPSSGVIQGGIQAARKSHRRKFVIGGPHGDTGLTGRKIIVDTYGGKGAHGGGAFSGKDPSKVDRSAAYAVRHVAKNLVAAGICDETLVQGGLRHRRCSACRVLCEYFRHGQSTVE